MACRSIELFHCCVANKPCRVCVCQCKAFFQAWPWQKQMGGLTLIQSRQDDVFRRLLDHPCEKTSSRMCVDLVKVEDEVELAYVAEECSVGSSTDSNQRCQLVVERCILRVRGV